MIEMIDVTYDETEGTILSPTETHWRCEAWLIDTDFIRNWNKFDEYVFSFSPETMTDHQMLFETIDNAKSLVEMRKSRFSTKERMNDKSSYEKNGFPYCSQLFQPKINVDFDHPDQLRGMRASLSGHIRDTADGRIYLQCDYVDLYEYPELPTDSASVDGSDDDW